MVSFTLLENALDSVEIGLEYFRKSRVRIFMKGDHSITSIEIG